MVIALNLRPALPGRTMRSDKCLRVDREMRSGCRMDIGGGPDRRDARAIAKQYAAAFERVRSVRFLYHCSHDGA